MPKKSQQFYNWPKKFCKYFGLLLQEHFNQDVTLLTQACMLTRTVKQLKPDFYSDDPSSNPAEV